MFRHTRLPFAAATALVALAISLLACTDAGPVPPGQPDVLLYIIDTLRADGLGTVAESRASTPHLDRLAEESVIFEQAFANAPWTRASVASILTGLHPTRHRVQQRHDALPGDVGRVAEQFSAAGYATAFITTNPNTGSFFGFAGGFDEMIELYERRRAGKVTSAELAVASDVVSDRAIAWIDSVERPFLLVVLTIDPHAPYHPRARFDPHADQYRGPMDGSLAALNRRHLGVIEKRRARQLYDAEIAFNDDSFGRLRDALEQRDLFDEMITIVTSDHGEEFWERGGTRGHGRSLSDDVLHVPLIVRSPSSRGTAPRRDVRSVELVDIVPTILDLAGLDLPPGLDGVPLLGESPKQRSATFAVMNLDGGSFASLRRHPWKLLRETEGGREVLFDLRSASPEVRALPPTKQHERVRAELSAELDAVLARTSAAAAVRPDGELPGDVEESLRALGYIE